MKSDRRRGMTMVEIMVSLLLAGITFAAIAAALTTGLTALRASRETEIAVQAAQREIENMRNSAFNGILTQSFPIPSLNTNGSIVAQTESTAAGDGRKKVSVNVSWISRGRSMRVDLVTHMTEKGINRKMKPTRSFSRFRTRWSPGALEQRAGFTLAETMVSVLLCSIVLGTIISVFMAQHRSFYVGNSYIDLSREARMAMDWMAGDIRWASALPLSHGGYSKSNTCVILEVPSIDPATGDIINVATTHDYIIYTQNGTSLQRVVDPNGSSKRTAETRTVAQRINLLKFTYGTESVDVTLTTRNTILSQNLSNTLSTTIKLRNK